MAKTVRVDLTDIEEADDGNTTYYGGSFEVGAETVYAHGNDRGDGYFDELYEELAKQLGCDSQVIYDATDALSDEDIHFSAGQILDITLEDDGTITGKEIKDLPPNPPSKEQAEYWLKAMGIEVKMVDGEPKIHATDVERVKKIFK